MNVESLLSQQEHCRNGRKNAEDFCTRPCRRCTRCRHYRAQKQDQQAAA